MTASGAAAVACPGTTYEGVDAMGRGRQKAKQTKVARALKYYSPQTDYDALQRELGHPDDLPNGQGDAQDGPDDDSYDYDSWAAGGNR
jgi:Protein of unknown function (DUF3073)